MQSWNLKIIKKIVKRARDRPEAPEEEMKMKWSPEEALRPRSSVE